MHRLGVLLLVVLAGCAQPVTGADVAVSGYLVSRDNDLHQQSSGGGSATVTCAADKQVHLLMLAGAEAWTEPAGWRIVVGKQELIAVEVDVLQAMVYVYGCLPLGQTVSSLRYERGSEILATAVVGLEPTMTP